MTSSTILDLPIEDIHVPRDRARDYCASTMLALAAILGEQDLQHPIRVRRVDDRYVLISGLYRLRAFAANGRATIPVSISSAASDDEAKLEEVMENLGRAELTALDRCHHLYELKHIHELKYPQALHGGDRKSIKRQSLPLDQDGTEVFGFSEALAEKLGLSARSIRLAVKIWVDLAPTSRRRLVGTALATKQTELKALSDESPVRQVKILDLILGEDHPSIENVTAALAFLEGGTAQTALEKRYRVLSEGLKALSPAAFDRLVAENEDRVVESLKRRGVI